MGDVWPKIHVSVEVERNLGDHGRIELVPITVDPDCTLRDLIDLAGDKQPGYYSMSTPSWMRLEAGHRIIVQVEQMGKESADE